MKLYGHPASPFRAYLDKKHPSPALSPSEPAELAKALLRFGIADAAPGGQRRTLSLAGFEIDAERWPRCARYHPALLARPSFEKAMAR